MRELILTIIELAPELIGITAGAVSDEDILVACHLVSEGADLPKERDEVELRVALMAIGEAERRECRIARTSTSACSSASGARILAPATRVH
jgi:hypothetical protein